MKISTKQAEQMFKSAQLIMLLARLIEHEYWIHHNEFPISSATKNHAKRIRESAERIQLESNYVLKIKNKEMMDDHVYELLRTLRIFLPATTDELKEINNALENDNHKIKEMQNLQREVSA